jgi:hypothetical protein
LISVVFGDSCAGRRQNLIVGPSNPAGAIESLRFADDEALPRALLASGALRPSMESSAKT